MTKNKFANLLAKLTEDPGLRQRLKESVDVDTAVATVRGAGFDISKADWIELKAMHAMELSDEELERISGGGDPDTFWCVETNHNYLACQPAPEDDGA